VSEGVHDDEVDEIDTGRHVCRLVDVVGVVLGVVVAELEPHGCEWYASPTELISDVFHRARVRASYLSMYQKLIANERKH
jgi:hypothetical protein